MPHFWRAAAGFHQCYHHLKHVNMATPAPSVHKMPRPKKVLVIPNWLEEYT
ncbi:hypothetical protein LMG24238_06326 [Paraburkholderia sediminicola]|uniref:Uncharacterized protein n=1 Tax=Paraburkholderia sediminicola TaxID=458836 RepID=A0A6J5CIQ9_9BURK|nr:hypothetical protein LMG24238_06326 [Paraburkholderia sediminicola]